MSMGGKTGGEICDEALEEAEDAVLPYLVMG